MLVLSLLPATRLDGVSWPAGWEVHSAPAGEATATVGAADFLLTGVGPVDAALLRAARRLRLVQAVGAGYDHVDLDAARSLGVPVANNPGHNAEAVAEYVVMATVYLLRQIGVYSAAVWQGRFAAVKLQPPAATGRELAEVTVGLLGAGHTSQATARRFRGAGVRRLYYHARHRLAAATEAELGLLALPWAELLPAVDVLSVHLPLTPATAGWLDAARLGLLPRGAVLVNTSRGGIVDETALVERLAAGGLAAAAVDVYEKEPPGPDSPLLAARALQPQLLLTPHVAGTSRRSWLAMLQTAVDNMARVARGEPPWHRVA